MSRPFPLTRIWGAVWTDDGPIAEVRDVNTRADFDAALNSDSFRWWAIQAHDCLSAKGHSKGGCTPAAPCAKCNTFALGWWFEHGKRTKARIYRPCREGARRTDAVDVADWGPRYDDPAQAMADARAGGYPWVCLLDGHGRKIEWIEVLR